MFIARIFCYQRGNIMKKIVISVLAICAATTANAANLRQYVALRASDVFAGTLDGGTDYHMDEFFGFAGAYGVKLADFRVELEGVYYTPGKVRNTSAKVQNTALFLNGYYDLRTNSPFTPYAGIGVGYNRMDLDAEKSYTDPALAAHVTIGAEWNVNRSISLDLAYRYNYFGENSKSHDTVRLWGHELILGARYKF